MNPYRIPYRIAWYLYIIGHIQLDTAVKVLISKIKRLRRPWNSR